MTAVWIGFALAVLLVLNHLSRVSSEVIEASWPDEVPVALHPERARDQHITHLVRLLGADDPHQAHALVADLLRRLEADRDAATAAFLADPPLDSAARYRHALDGVLTRIEAT